MDQNFKCQLKLDHCLRYYVQKVVFEILKDLYYNHPCCQKQFISINEFLRKIDKSLCRPKKRYDNDFPEIYKFEEELDISYCFKIIKDLKIVPNKNEDYIETFPNGKEVFSILKIFHIFRNKITHENLKINKMAQIKDEICCNLDKLGKFMSTLVQEPGFVLYNAHQDYQTLVKMQIEDLNKFWEENLLGTSDLDELMSSNTINKVLLTKFINEFKVFLRNKYSKYIPISYYLQNKIFKNDCFTQIYLKDAFNNTYTIWKKELFFSENERGNFLICGDANQGKTSICKKLIYEWKNCDKLNFTLLWIQMKNIEKITLTQYLKILLPSLFTEETSNEGIIKFLRKLEIFIIIDSIDEIVDSDEESSQNNRNLIDDCLEILNEKNFLITLRQSNLQLAESLLKKNGFDGQYKIYNIKESQINTDDIFLNKDYQKDFIEFFNTLPIYLHYNLDLSLTHFVVHLWLKNKNLNLGTCKDLFIELENFVKREKNNNKWIKGIDCVLDNIAESYFNDHKNHQNFEYKYINEMIIQQIEKDLKNIGLNQDFAKEIFSSLFLISNSPILQNSKKGQQYELIHKMQVSWLIARHLYHLVVTKMELDNLRTFLDNKSDRDIVAFTFGLLTANNYLEKVLAANQNILESKLISPLKNLIFKKDVPDFNYLWAILRETTEKNSKIMNPDCELLVKKILNGQNKWKLNLSNVVSGICILTFSSIHPDSINICIKETLNMYKIRAQHFLLALKELKNKATAPNKKIDITLSFKKSIQKGTEYVHNEYLENLLSSCFELIEFSGYVEKINLLQEFKKLKKLNLLITSHQMLNELCNICKIKGSPIMELHLILSNLFMKVEQYETVYQFCGTKVSLEMYDFKNWEETKIVLNKFKKR